MLCTTPRLLNRLRIVAGACAALLTVGCGGVGGAASLATPYSPQPTVSSAAQAPATILSRFSRRGVVHSI